MSITAGAISAKVELDTDPTWKKRVNKNSNSKETDLTKDMKRSSLGMAAAREKVTITMRYLKVLMIFSLLYSMDMFLPHPFADLHDWGAQQVQLELKPKSYLSAYSAFR